MSGSLLRNSVHTAGLGGVVHDPETMPSDLVKAHIKLDKAVDAAYEADGGQKTWSGDLERVKFLFLRYKALAPTKSTKKPARAKKAVAATA